MNILSLILTLINNDMFDAKRFRKDKKLTQAQLGEILNCGQANVSAIEKTGKDLEPHQLKLLYEKFGFEDVKNYVYPEMTENTSSQNYVFPIKRRLIREESPKSYGEGEIDYKLVPLVNIDSVGGLRSLNELTSDDQFVERFIPFTGAKEGDKAIYQSGDSMTPTIPPGSILQIRKVDDWQEYFGYGGIFVLWLKDDRRITKQVKKYSPDPQNFVTCHSFNPDAADEELPKRFIREVWKVIKVLTDKGW